MCLRVKVDLLRMKNTHVKLGTSLLNLLQISFAKCHILWTKITFSWKVTYRAHAWLPENLPCKCLNVALILKVNLLLNIIIYVKKELYNIIDCTVELTQLIRFSPIVQDLVNSESPQYQCPHENWVCLKFPWTQNSLLICVIETTMKLGELILADGIMWADSWLEYTRSFLVCSTVVPVWW